MFLSIAVRLLANVEALNMVETVGNVARHRRAPVIAPTEDGYVLTYVPVVSGECLGHAYQRWLATIAEQRKLPVCSNCKQGIFVKHGEVEVFGELAWEVELKKKLRKLKAAEIESTIAKNCVVEDIGGFLLPEEIPARRTSRFQVSFMIPALEQLQATAAEAQFHVRYALDPRRHRIYYTEAGSALYTFRFDLDLANIGYATSEERRSIVDEEERKARALLAVDTLAHMLENRVFGARLARYNPITDLRSMIVLLSRPLPFTASSGHERGFIEDIRLRAEEFLRIFPEEKVDGWFLDNEQLGVEPYSSERLKLEKVSSVSEAFRKVRELIAEELG